jgi:hypothetical protein
LEKAMWRRLLGLGEVALVVVFLPVFLIAVVIPAEALDVYRLSLPRNRRAIRLAREAFATQYPKIEVAYDKLVDVRRHRCYVVLIHRCKHIPPMKTLYAVWYATGKVCEVTTAAFNGYMTSKACSRDFEQMLAIEGTPTDVEANRTDGCGL